MKKVFIIILITMAVAFVGVNIGWGISCWMTPEERQAAWQEDVEKKLSAETVSVHYQGNKVTVDSEGYIINEDGRRLVDEQGQQIHLAEEYIRQDVEEYTPERYFNGYFGKFWTIIFYSLMGLFVLGIIVFFLALILTA